VLFVESVRAGFATTTKRKTCAALAPLITAECPFANLPEKKGPGRIDREKMRAVTWLRPTALAEIAFNEKTSAGHLRHAKFLQLREAEDSRHGARDNGPSKAPQGGVSRNCWQFGTSNAFSLPMSVPAVDYEDIALTLIGSFNPAIFHPSWFERHEIISSADAAKAVKAVQTVSPEYSDLVISDIRLTVFPDRLQLVTKDASKAEMLYDIALNILSILPETPLTAAGINNSIEFNLNNEAYWHKIGHTLAPKELVWNGLLKEAGMQTLVIKGRRDDFPGEINVTVQPSPPQRYVYGLRIAVNFHYTPDVDKKLESAANDVAEMVESYWKLALGEARLVGQQILSKIEKP
jgi:hypothetical protein